MSSLSKESKASNTKEQPEAATIEHLELSYSSARESMPLSSAKQSLGFDVKSSSPPEKIQGQNLPADKLIMIPLQDFTIERLTDEEFLFREAVLPDRVQRFSDLLLLWTKTLGILSTTLLWDLVPLSRRVKGSLSEFWPMDLIQVLLGLKAARGYRRVEWTCESEYIDRFSFRRMRPRGHERR